MKIKSNFILYISGGLICIAIFMIVVKFFSDNPYREQLPDLPGMQAIPIPLRDQITAAMGTPNQSPKEKIVLLDLTNAIPSKNELDSVVKGFGDQGRMHTLKYLVRYSYMDEADIEWIVEHRGKPV